MIDHQPMIFYIKYNVSIRRVLEEIAIYHNTVIGKIQNLKLKMLFYCPKVQNTKNY